MIREATLEDVPYTVQSLKQLVDHVRERSQDAYFIELEENYDQGFGAYVTEFVKSEKSQVLIAEVNHDPVGMLLGRETSPAMPISKIKRIGEIVVCWVDPDYRQRGISQSLIAQIEDWFAKRDLHYVELYYIVGNTEAELTWQNLGYQPYRITARKHL